MLESTQAKKVLNFANMWDLRRVTNHNLLDQLPWEEKYTKHHIIYDHVINDIIL